jgi:hypothetical protein
MIKPKGIVEIATGDQQFEREIELGISDGLFMFK